MCYFVWFYLIVYDDCIITKLILVYVCWLGMEWPIQVSNKLAVPKIYTKNTKMIAMWQKWYSYLAHNMILKISLMVNAFSQTKKLTRKQPHNSLMTVLVRHMAKNGFNGFRKVDRIQNLKNASRGFLYWLIDGKGGTRNFIG